MYSIGIDISKLTFTASCVDLNFNLLFYGKTFDQNEKGWQGCIELLQQNSILRDQVKIVMENTGVYSEKICYYLHEQGFDLFVEPPHQISQAFYEEDKDDPIDSRQIAEYGFRYPDRLHPWQPPDEIIEQIQLILTTREQLTKMVTMCKNTLISLKKKHRSYEGIQQIYQDMIDVLEKRLKQIHVDLKTTIATNPILHQKTQDILSISNVGIILTAHLLLATNGYQRIKYTSLAKYSGISPRKHESGTSVKKKKQSRGVGPRQLRKNLYLAAMRLRKNHPEFRKYFERKVKEGKAPKLVMNNIENKLLKTICGVLKSNKPYIENYRSMKPEP